MTSRRARSFYQQALQRAIAGASGLFQRAGAAMIAIYYDDPDTTPQDQLRSDAAIVVMSGSSIGLVRRPFDGRGDRGEHGWDC